MKRATHILILFMIPSLCFSQVDSLFGTYITASLGNSPRIIIYSDSTFGYYSPIDIGQVPEMKGKINIQGDTIFFQHYDEIHPIVINIKKRNNPNSSFVTISCTGCDSKYYSDDSGPSIYINEPFSEYGKIYSMGIDNLITLDSLDSNDSVFIHPGMYSKIKLDLDILNYNEYHYDIELPNTATIYYLDEEKALFNNGFLYFEMTTDGIPYFNTNIYKKKKDLKRIYRLIWQRRMEKLENTTGNKR